MTATTNLGITHLSLGQGQKEVTINQAYDAFDLSVAGFLSLSVAGSSDVTLTDTFPSGQAKNSIIKFTGALTGDINVIVPSLSRTYVLENATTGAQTLTVKTAAGSGFVLTQGNTSLCFCDGTDVFDVVGGVSSPGDVVGPASSTDNAVVRFDTTTGKLVQNSSVLIDDTDNMTGVVSLAVLGSTTPQLLVESQDAGATGAVLDLYHNSASPAADDDIGIIKFSGENASDVKSPYGEIRCAIIDTTAALEDAKLEFWVLYQGVLSKKLSIEDTLVTFLNEDGTATGSIVELYQNSLSPAVDDDIGILRFSGEDDGSNKTIYAEILTSIVDPTDTTEDAKIEFWVQSAGTLTNKFTIEPTSATLVGDLTVSSGGVLLGAAVGATDGTIQWTGSDFEGRVSAAWVSLTGAGDVVKVGTPVNDQLGVWTGDGTIEGDANLTWDGAGRFALAYVDAGTTGVVMELYQDSSTPAAEDDIGIVRFAGEDASSVKTTYSEIRAAIVDTTDTSEDGKLELWVADAGTLTLKTTVDSTGLSVVGLVESTSNGFKFPDATTQTTAGVTGSGSNGLVAIYTGSNTIEGTSSFLMDDGGGSAIAIFDMTATNDGIAGPLIDMIHLSNTPAVNDQIGRITFQGRDAALGGQVWGTLRCVVGDLTAGQEYGKFEFETVQNGSNTTSFQFNPASGESSFTRRTDGTTGPWIRLDHLTTTAADGDLVGYIEFRGRDDGGGNTVYSQIVSVSTDVTDTTEDGRLDFDVMSAGALTTKFQVLPTSATVTGDLTVNSGDLIVSAGKLDITGGIVFNYTNFTTTPQTLDSTHHIVTVDATTGNSTINLPTAVGISGTEYVIKKTDATANTVTIDGATTETIDGATTKVLSNQYDFVQIQSDGADWVIVAEPAGSGAVAISGTPADNQVALWTDAATIEGDANFTFDGTDIILGATHGIKVGNTTTATDGTMRYTGTDFEGRKGGTYVSFTTGGAVVSGTPADNQIAIWTGATDIEGDANLTWDATLFTIVTAGDPGILWQSNSVGGFGPVWELYHNSASPAVSDVLTQWNINGEDSISTKTTYGRMNFIVDDVTDASEDGRWSFFVAEAGGLSAKLDIRAHQGSTRSVVSITGDAQASGGMIVGNTSLAVAGNIRWTGSAFEGYDGASWNQLGGGAAISGTPANNQIAIWTGATDIEGDANFTWDGASFIIVSSTEPIVQLQSNSVGSFGPVMDFWHQSSSPAATDTICQINWYGEDSTDAKTAYARLNIVIDDPVNGSEDGKMSFQVANDGAVPLQTLVIQSDQGNTRPTVYVDNGDLQAQATLIVGTTNAPTLTTRLYVEDAGRIATAEFLAEFHVDDTNPYALACFNDTNSTTVPGLMVRVNDTGTALVGNQNNDPISFFTNGVTNILMTLEADGSISLFGGAGVGSGVDVLSIKDAGTNPSTNPTGGGILYSDAGAGKWRGSSGTTTTFGPAEPHCPTCGTDYMMEWDNDTFGYLAVCMHCLTDELGDRPWILRMKR